MDKQSRLCAGNGILRDYVKMAGRQHALQLWRRYLCVSKEGSVSDLGHAATAHFHILFSVRRYLVEVMALCRSGGDRSVLKSAQQYASIIYTAIVAGLPFKGCNSLGNSLYLRAMLAALLHSLYETDGEQFRDELQQLAWMPPPFSSWNSAPASEDDWLDPMDEVFVDSDSSYPWELQVRQL